MTDGSEEVRTEGKHHQDRRLVLRVSLVAGILAIAIVGAIALSRSGSPAVTPPDASRQAALTWTKNNQEMWSWMQAHWYEMNQMHQHWGDVAWMQANLPDWDWMQARWGSIVWMQEHWQTMGWMHAGGMMGSLPGGMMGQP